MLFLRMPAAGSRASQMRRSAAEGEGTCGEDAGRAQRPLFTAGCMWELAPSSQPSFRPKKRESATDVRCAPTLTEKGS
jgi:hypothetical protein